MNLKNKFRFIILLLTISIAGCKKWDDHIAVNNADLSRNLFEIISSNTDLSKFKEYVVQTGLDTVLQSSKTYTVWAPSNAALQTLDPAIVSDKAKLKSFLLNHIAAQTYFVRDAQPGLRVAMLNGKYNAFSSNKFDEATLTASDKYVSNGVLHIIDKGIVVLPNIWEFINSTIGTYNQNSYIASLNFNSFDASLATIDSISAITGNPVYKPGTGLVLRNRFNDRVFDLKREDKQYTYFVMANNAFTVESDSLRNYYKTASTTSTDSLVKWNVVKDLVVEGVLTSLPPSIISRSGIVVPLDASAIIETRKVSNGIVYVMSRLDVPTVNKFKEIIIQGEAPSGFMADRTGNTAYRVRTNPVTGSIFNDILVSGHGLTAYYAFYRLAETPSIKYKVYVTGVNDFQTAAFSQTIIPKYLTAPNTYTTLASFTHAVRLSTAVGAYNEILLGEFTMASFGTLELQLTAIATSPIVLDYLRLVPVP